MGVDSDVFIPLTPRVAAKPLKKSVTASSPLMTPPFLGALRTAAKLGPMRTARAQADKVRGVVQLECFRPATPRRQRNRCVSRGAHDRHRNKTANKGSGSEDCSDIAEEVPVQTLDGAKQSHGVLRRHSKC